MSLNVLRRGSSNTGRVVSLPAIPPIDHAGHVLAVKGPLRRYAPLTASAVARPATTRRDGARQGDGSPDPKIIGILKKPAQRPAQRPAQG